MTTEQTPLEQLTAANERFGKSRKRPAKPRQNVGKDVERYYRTQLRSLVRLIQREIESEVMPIVKSEKRDYQADSDATDATPTMDNWADRIIAALRRLADRFVSEQFTSQYDRLARSTVSRADAESTEAFVASVNQAVGVDMRPLLSSEDMAAYTEAAAYQNAQLIKSVPEEYLKRVETAVLGGVRDGDAPSTISRRIQEATGVTRRRADILARDQVSKLTSEIGERRQRQSGISYYRSVTAGDERVTGNPAGKYPNAKISCYGIARKDVGYGPGVYRWDKGASWGGETGLHPGRHHPLCRCTATPVFDFELPKKARQ